MPQGLHYYGIGKKRKKCTSCYQNIASPWLERSSEETWFFLRL